MNKILHTFTSCVALVVLAGCAGQTPTEGTSTSQPPADGTTPGHELLSSTGVTKDITHWTLATDPLLDPYLSDMELEASGKVVKLCMDRRGFTDYPTARSADMPYEDTRPNGISMIFTPTTAAKYGYRQAPLPGYTVLDVLPQEDPRPGFLEAYTECQDLGLKATRPQVKDREAHTASTSTTPVDTDQAQNTWISQFDALQVDRSDPALTAAAARWKACLQEAEPSTVLPDQPWDMLHSQMPSVLQDRFDWQPTGEAGSEEIAFATHDATCRESSGWTTTLYDLEWEQHAQFAAEHQSEIDAEVATHQEALDRFREISAHPEHYVP